MLYDEAAKEDVNSCKLLEFVVHTVFQLTYLKKKDVAMFNDDPLEFIRRDADPVDNTTRQTAMDLIVRCCSFKPARKKKSKCKDLLQPLLLFFGNALAEYNNKIAMGEGADQCVKEAILYVIGNLSEVIKTDAYLLSNIEQLLLDHCYPELEKGISLLKYQAIYIYSEYSFLVFKDKDHLIKATNLFFSNLKDGEPGVKLQAAISMKELIKKDVIKDQIRCNVAIVVDLILKLMNEFDHEDMIGTLETFVNEYTDEVRPYATALTTKLAEAFNRIMDTMDADEDGVNDNILVATNCLETI